jgi:hypothetical protein
MPQVRATARYGPAIEAVHELLSKLRLEFLFVGNVARSAWLGSEVASGSIDVLATMGPQQKNQVAMMGSNRGFRVERDEIEATEELDIVPMRFDDVRIHVLVASNALYGRMVKDGVDAQLGERTLRIPTAEDFALLLAMMGDDVGLHALTGGEDFDRSGYNDKLRSIGLGDHIVAP